MTRHKTTFKILIACLAIALCVYGGLIVRHQIGVKEGTTPAFQNQTAIVDGLRDCLKAQYNKIEINYRSNGEYGDVMDVVVQEWMDLALSPTGVPDEGDYLRYQMGSYTVRYTYDTGLTAHQCTIYIEPTYYLTLDQKAQVEEKITAIMEGFAFDETTTDIEKVDAICKYILDNVSYDNIHKGNVYYHMDATAYGALIYQAASCQGYSVSLNRLLLEAGIDNRIITGDVVKNGETEYHAWNLVAIDGLYYNLDITWTKEMETQEYYLKGDTNFLYHYRDGEFATEAFKQTYPVSPWDY